MRCCCRGGGEQRCVHHPADLFVQHALLASVFLSATQECVRHPELAVLCGITSRMPQSVGSMPAASYSRGPCNFARLAACNTLENSSSRAAAPADGKQQHARLTASDLNPFRQYFHRFGRASVFKPRTHHLTSTGIPLQRRYCALSGCSSSALSINSASHGCSLGLTLWHPYTMPHATLTSRRSGDCLRKVCRQMQPFL